MNENITERIQTVGVRFIDVSIKKESSVYLARGQVILKNSVNIKMFYPQGSSHVHVRSFQSQPNGIQEELNADDFA